MKPLQIKTDRKRHLAVPVSEHDHVQGDADAPLVLVEYADYECPYCGEADRIVKELQQELANRLCFVFRNFPLSEKHDHSERAAEAAEAAGAQGLFWEMHDLLFENQDSLADQELLDYALEAGVERSRWLEELESGRCAERVLGDARSGNESGVRGTPTFFINGVRHTGDYDLDTMLAALTAKAPA